MRKKNLISAINVTPFVDVVLVLLIVFMVSSPMSQNVIEVNLPKSSIKENKNQQDENIILTITHKGELYINGREIQFENLETEITSISNDSNDVKIFVRGDKDANYGKISDVISSIKSAGYQKVSLISEKK